MSHKMFLTCLDAIRYTESKSKVLEFSGQDKLCPTCTQLTLMLDFPAFWADVEIVVEKE